MTNVRTKSHFLSRSDSNYLICLLGLIALMALSLSCSSATPVAPPAQAPATAATTKAPSLASPAVSATAAPGQATTSASVTKGSDGKITIVDDAGRTVTLLATPKRIISLAPSNTEILFALGLGDRVVGVTTFCDYPVEAKDKPKVGGFSDVDTEKVIAASPDLILAASIHRSKTLPALEALGLPVVILDSKNIDDVTNKLLLVGQMTGKETEAQTLKGTIEGRIAAITAKAKTGASPKLFWMLGDSLFTVGPGSFVDDLITRAGGTNIAKDAKTQYPELSMEAVISADPDYVVVLGDAGKDFPTKLRADTNWQKVRAIRENKIIFIEDANIVSRPGPRIADGLEALAKALKPEAFR